MLEKKVREAKKNYALGDLADKVSMQFADYFATNTTCSSTWLAV